MITRILSYLMLLAPSFFLGQVTHFGTLGNGFSNSTFNAVRALYYDTLTKKLYAGGQFNVAEGKTVWGAAVWNGSSWDSLRGGLTQFPQQSVTVNSAGPVVWKITGYKGKIYYLGGFDWVNGKNQYNMGVWNGSNWDYPLTNPISSNSAIYDMTVYNDMLYACGDFTAIGNVACNYVAKFDGTSWQAVGDFSKFHLQGHAPAQMNAIEVYNNEIYVGGAFDDSSGVPHNIAKYDGTKWVSVGTGIRQGGVISISALQSYNHKLYIGGTFSKTYEIPGGNLIAWNGSDFESVIPYPINSYVNSFIINKNKLVVLGQFTTLGENEAMCLLVLDSSSQCSLRGMSSTFSNYCVWSSIASMNDTIVIGGQFNFIDTIPAKNIATIIDYEEKTNCFYTHISEHRIGSSSVKIFPNPTKDQIAIEFTEIETANFHLELTGILGQTLFTKKELQLKESIDLRFLPAGIYYLKIQNISSQKVFKIVKE